MNLPTCHIKMAFDPSTFANGNLLLLKSSYLFPKTLCFLWKVESGIALQIHKSVLQQKRS